MSTSEARACLPDLLDRVERGEEVTITRHGKPIAVVVRPDALRTRRAAAAFAKALELDALLDQGRRTPLSELPPLDAVWADELVAEIRRDRDRD